MAITQKQLGERLQAMRKAAGLTQDQIADRAGMPRSAVSNIEAGTRAVTSLELDVIADFLGVDIRQLLAAEFSGGSPLSGLFRAEPSLASSPEVNDALRRCLRLARETANLERLLGRGGASPSPRYQVRGVEDRYAAIEQAKRIAESERHRMGLGDQPVPDLVRLLEANGVRVTFTDLPDGVSGVTLAPPQVGPIVAVRRNEAVRRRRFSLAHEYGHVLMHREGDGMVSRMRDEKSVIEMQANAFAANFLVPAPALFSQVDALGKRRSIMYGTEADGAGEAHLVQVRPPEGSTTIELQDVVRLAAHFGVSRHVMVIRLRNLKLLSEAESKSLLDLERSGGGARMERLLGLQQATYDDEPRGYIADLVSLALDAYEQNKITRGKLMEILSEVKTPEEMVEAEASIGGGMELDVLEPVF